MQPFPISFFFLVGCNFLRSCSLGCHATLLPTDQLLVSDLSKSTSVNITYVRSVWLFFFPLRFPAQIVPEVSESL